MNSYTEKLISYRLLDIMNNLGYYIFSMFTKRRDSENMNKQERDILRIMYVYGSCSQREISEKSGHSLGIVNRSVNSLIDKGYLDRQLNLLKKAEERIQDSKPQRAIILAAGFGMRMVPINLETPKALLEINGECLIERQIKQLHEVGITEIYVVVGFLKERFEYLIDEYGVELIFNPEYSTKGNIFSMYLARQHMENAYIIPCDIWCDRNPFDKYELYSWYMVSDLIDDDSEIRVNRKSELVRINKSDSGNTMIGISYLLKHDACLVRNNIEELLQDKVNNGCFWENALYGKEKMIVAAKIAKSTDVVEINTYEQLRELDSDSEHLKSDAIDTVKEALVVNTEDIYDITVLKKGMTNRSFMFSCNEEKYIMRIPGEGTEHLINRNEEYNVYQVIKDQSICDDIIYMNPENGYKITKYIHNARVCDSYNNDDLKKCMNKLKEFHNKKLKVSHEFNIFEKIDFYESLWGEHPSIYKDYEKTKSNVASLSPYINEHSEKKVLTHIDAVPDNFLFTVNADGEEEIRLIDWEYAGMQDPHVDIAMFCIYSLYDRAHVENLIDIYFEGNCPDTTRTKIYCYIAACGLLWSNWCEYKRNLGVEFGEYSIRQYRYAKEYYKLAKQRMED